MNLPIQSQPVMRNVSTAPFSGGMEASSLPCTIACAGCSALSGIAKTLCTLAAKAAGCDC
ncbi:hypothetical protein [Microcystis aeruginosa]|uniref:hypothetical protein n=1 Tax=Microcystis aeruginosa TaxID=1126 RepID=UPI000B2E61DB|nr:hypothetical protein [Microcystis aeruginosa]